MFHNHGHFPAFFLFKKKTCHEYTTEPHDLFNQ